MCVCDVCIRDGCFRNLVDVGHLQEIGDEGFVISKEGSAVLSRDGLKGPTGETGETKFSLIDLSATLDGRIIIRRFFLRRFTFSLEKR